MKNVEEQTVDVNLIHNTITHVNVTELTGADAPVCFRIKSCVRDNETYSS